MAVVAASISFIVTVLFMFALRPVAIAVGLVDVPGGRKRHGDIVPIIGGIAMILGFGFGAALVDLPPYWGPTFLAMCLLTIVGTIDDRFDIPASVRLIAQMCAGLFVVLGSDVVVSSLGSPFVDHAGLGILAVPFSVAFIVTIINAFNLIDGIDGLAGGLALLSLASLAFIGGGTDTATIATIGAAVVVGFLLFNLPAHFNQSVRTFMGDAGSTSLGLVIAMLGIHVSQGPDALISPVIGLWLVAVPVFDLFSAIVRRLMEGRSPFAPDHAHLHHVLADNGLSRRAALGWMLSMAAACAACGAIGDWLSMSDSVMLVLWFMAGGLYYQTMRRPGLVVMLHSTMWPLPPPYAPGSVDRRRH